MNPSVSGHFSLNDVIRVCITVQGHKALAMILSNFPNILQPLKPILERKQKILLSNIYDRYTYNSIPDGVRC